MSTQVKIYTMQNCPYCVQAKKLLQARNIAFEESLVLRENTAEWDRLYKLSGMRTMPQIFAGERLIGGYTELAALDKKDTLSSLKE